MVNGSFYVNIKYILNFNFSADPFQEQVTACDRKYQPQRQDSAE